MKTVSEGVKRKSLEHLIQPVLSIDEYESKISDKRVIVVGFFCGDKDPANDLSDFIDSSSLPILDTEVSPAPTPDGYYVVWVEIARSKKFPGIVKNLLKEVDNLTNIDDWKFQCPAQQDAVELDDENILQYIILDPAEILEPPEKQENDTEDTPEPENSKNDLLAEFWRASLADKIELSENFVNFYKNNTVYKFHIQPTLPDSIDFLVEDGETRYLKSLLGPAYDVYKAADGFVVESDKVAVHLKSVDFA